MEGDARSDASREKAHGHHLEHEFSFVKKIRKTLALLGIGQPDAEDIRPAPKARRDPLEDTPEEALQELQREIRGQRGAPPHGDTP